MKFTELGLHPDVQSGVEACQFIDCTPIQEAAIPHILAGRDIAGLAQTGTGKTAAFVLPLIDRILRAREAQTWRQTNFVLVLVPTRELAEQVYDHVTMYGAKANVKAIAIYGGTSYEGQKAALKGGVDFVVATPGRLIDLYKEHLVDLSLVRAIVFDEADRMFDMGFKDDMKYILRRVPQDRHFLVFSATLNFDVLNTAYEFGANPVEINVSRDQAKAENVVDAIFHVGHGDKPKFLLSILQKYKPQQVIVFSNFKHNVDRIAKFLSSNSVPAMGISSLISQSQRTRIMELFRAEGNNRNILVATDLAARGLDIKGVDMVINFELPDDAENYIHRIGRTGRAGASGHAYSMVCDKDVESLQRIENYLGHKLTVEWIDDAELVKEFKEFPRDEGRRHREFKRDDRPGGSRSDHNKTPNKGRNKEYTRQNRKDFRRDDNRGGQQPEQRNEQQPTQRNEQQPTQRNEQQPTHKHQSSSRPYAERGPRHQQRQQYRRQQTQDGPRQHHSLQRPQHQKSNVTRQGYRHQPSQSAPPSQGVASVVAGFLKKIFGG
ncbi:MAG: hypothetical protein A2Z20_08810 [Bdellovibrionales bacterium RBG_16_40_8]|nr:MAG: hypothetical protein A2Z20_08810 [Bdellovibrionales bacterium RBG_16_40_8]